MNIKEIIFKELNKRHKITTAEVVKKTGFSRAYVHRFFKKLQDEGRIVLIGRANNAFYVLPNSGYLAEATVFGRTFLNRAGLQEDLTLMDIKKEKPAIFRNLPAQIADIFDYAFTEILNNAIEHSGSKKIFVGLRRNEETIGFRIFDWGVGIFNHIQKKFRLKSLAEAIEHLLKGRQTTAPEVHTGEGLFFTSRVADFLKIKSSNNKIIFDNKIDDVFVGETARPVKGTKVIFSVALKSDKNLQEVFRKYSDENFVFSKTDFKVKILELGGKTYISRSEARRLLFGLDKFKQITLDFKKVNSIGQGFADEVFRVWHKKNPKIKVNYLNTNKNIEMMIKRALLSAENK